MKNSAFFEDIFLKDGLCRNTKKMKTRGGLGKKNKGAKASSLHCAELLALFGVWSFPGYDVVLFELCY